MMPKLVISARAKIKLDTAMDFMHPLEVTGLGIIKKLSDKKFILTDIMFPPQENEGSFVTTKDDEFPSWFFEYIVKKDLHTACRLHFHSHPRFPTRPSSTDVKQFQDFMTQIDDYMIQLILSGNKNYQPHCMIHYVDGPKQQMEIEYEYQDKVIPILKKVTNAKSKQISLFDIPDTLDIAEPFKIKREELCPFCCNPLGLIRDYDPELDMEFCSKDCLSHYNELQDEAERMHNEIEATENY